MDIKALKTGIIALLMAMPTLGKDIYKCEVNGAVKYQEEKCDENSVPVHLKELAAPLGSIDAKTINSQSTRNQESAIKERIARHQKRIRNYRKRMEAEVGALQNANSKQSKRKKNTPRNSVKDQEQSSSLNSIASKVDNGAVPDQINAAVNHYKALIEAEQFQIKLLRQEQKMNQKLNGDK